MKYVIGAYATAPSLQLNDKLLEQNFYDSLVNSIPQIEGLEIPFFGENIHKFGSEFMLNIIRPDWNNVLSCIPGVMNNLSINPHFGIASDNLTGRSEAVAMCRRANEFIHRINDHFGRQSVKAIQLVTAPSFPVKGVASSKESLTKSIEELLTWDWDCAKIVIEHADACVSELPFEKGFLTLEDEILVLSKLLDSYEIGITINWARSAIEGKNVNKPLKHIKLANKFNLLSGLMFSGTTDNDKNYGKWKDMHMPFARSCNVKYFEQNSLLTYENISNVLKSVDINKLDYLGIKLLSMPLGDSDISRRVGLNQDAIFILENIISELQLLN
jgi:hypothetical protein